MGQTCTITDLKLGSVAVVTIVSRLALKLCLKCRKGKRVRNGKKIIIDFAFRNYALHTIGKTKVWEEETLWYCFIYY